MIILKAIFVAAISTFISGSVTGIRHRARPLDVVAAEDAAGRDRRHGRQLIAGQGFAGCIELRNGRTKSGSRLILGNCKNYTNGFDNRELENGWQQLYSRKDPTMCITASSPLRDGTFLRLRKCKEENDKQWFAWGNQLQPMERENQVVDTGKFCITYAGNKPDIGDFIKVRECSRIRDGDAWWSNQVYPDGNY
jgi:hypothetical protein